MGSSFTEDSDLAGIRKHLDQLWRKVTHSLHPQTANTANIGARRGGFRVLASEAVNAPDTIDSLPGHVSTLLSCDSPEEQMGSESEGFISSGSPTMKRRPTAAGRRNVEEQSQTTGKLKPQEESLEKEMALEELDMVKRLLSRLSEDQVLRWKGKMKDDLLIAMQREKHALEAELDLAWQSMDFLEQRVHHLERGLSEDRSLGGERIDGGTAGMGTMSGTHVNNPVNRSSDSTVAITETRETEHFREARESKLRLGSAEGAKKGGERSGVESATRTIQQTFFPRPPLHSRSTDRERAGAKRERVAMEAYAERVTNDLAAAQQSLVTLGQQLQQLVYDSEVQTRKLNECEGQLVQMRKERDSLVMDLKAALGGWSAAADELAAFSQQNVELGREIELLQDEGQALRQSLRDAVEEREALCQERDRWQAHKDIIGELARMDTCEGRSRRGSIEGREFREPESAFSDYEASEWQLGKAGLMHSKSNDLINDWDADVRNHLPPILVMGTKRSPSFPPRVCTVPFTPTTDPQKSQGHIFVPRAPDPTRVIEKGTHARETSHSSSSSSMERGEKHAGTDLGLKGKSEGKGNTTGLKPFGGNLYPTQSFSEWQRSETAPVPERKRTPPHSPPLARKPVPIRRSRNF